MSTEIPIYIQEDVVPRLIDYCRSHRRDRLTLVADQNTHAALGQKVEEALQAQNLDVKTVILNGREVVTDEHYIVQVLLHADRTDRTYLAVGSGTITDIVRFASHRTKADFISIPTAPSVDGFTSVGAPMVVGGFKQTVSAQAPLAVFADLETLCTAPRPMLAAGLGDVLGKFTSLADWRLGRLLWKEPYSDEIAGRTRQALENCMKQADGVAAAAPPAIEALMAGLIESGLCILEFGTSRPASGSEHHLSHYWEMKLLTENRPAVLHGAKVGLGTVIIAGRYQDIGQLTQEQVREKLTETSMPDREQEIQQIKTAYPESVAGQIIADHAPFLNLTEPAYKQIQQKIIDNWPEIREIAASVPPSETVTELLRRVDGPTQPNELGLSQEEVELAKRYSHYLRNRFTVMKLSRMLGIQ